MVEIWAKIPGYEHYKISSYGRVRTLAGRILKYDKAGRPNYRYNSVRLHFKEGRVHLVVHKLVYLAFKGDIPDGAQIDHIDRNRFNNHIDNLRAATPEENQLNKTNRINAISEDSPPSWEEESLYNF